MSTATIGGLEIPALWLRDACACAECRHAGSGQRLHSVLELDPDTRVTAVTVDGDDVEITFAPTHTARFSLGWLREHAPGRAPVFDDRSERARRPWTAADLPLGAPTVAWADLRGAGDVAARLRALRDLTDRGVLLVREVPVVPGSVLEVARSIGHVRTTNYGDLFDVRVEPQPVNLAYTGRAIAPHTDNPYRDPVPGVQLLHCLTSSASGGENVLLDGFSVAAVLREEDPAAFATLSTTRLTFRYDDDRTALRASGPAIELNADGEVRGIRWNDRSIEPPQVAPSQVPEVYRALRAFAAVLARPELHLHLTLAPGDCIVFDNTRILHARTAFSDGGGARHLQGCYADLDGVASSRAVLERAAAAAAMAALENAFASSEGMAYLGEDVTMIEHQLQAGALAAASGADDALVVACLLHDVGHMVGQVVGEREATAALAADADAHHDESGARWLAQWFGPEVTEPVRLHVAAKRYLVATEPDYAARLSPASVRTLRLQGGPMSADEVAAFAANPAADAAVALRRFDEAAKDARVAAPPLSAHRDRIMRVLRG